MLMEKKYDELAKYFCFDRKKTTMEEFFGDLSAFCKDFEVSSSPQHRLFGWWYSYRTWLLRRALSHMYH